MSYQKKTYRFRNAIEVEEYHSARYGNPGEGRREKGKPTPEQMERKNQWNKEKRCRHRLREYYEVNDYFVTLTYRKEDRPEDMAEAKEHYRKFIGKLRREYRKRGYELRWIRNIEVGTKGAWHIHLVINRIPDIDLILTDAWPYGFPDIKLLRKFREFAELAAYLTKTPKTDSKLRETDYNCSRNMPLKEPEVKVYKRWKTWKEPKVPDGWYLDRDSVAEGINPVTGYPFRHYTLLRVMRK